MATPGKGVRSTRKLRQWTVEQVESGKFPGLVWDDPPAKTMFRIPWKHAGKQEFRHDEDAGFFKAWAIFKGKYRPGERMDPATWKTRVRCALTKSPEFAEVQERSRQDIAEPYKVYRLVPLTEQRVAKPPKGHQSRKVKVKVEHSSTSSETENGSPSADSCQLPISLGTPNAEGSSGSEALGSRVLVSSANLLGDFSPQPGEPAPDANEIALGLKQEPAPIETPTDVGPGKFSLWLSVFYSGELVHKVWLPEGDCLITSVAASPGTPVNSMRRVVLPHPATLSDPRKLKATQQLLKDLERGVMAASNPEGIFIQSRGEASISWQGLAKSQSSGMLKRNAFLNVFSTKVFDSALQQFHQNLRPFPEPQLTLCVGEKLEPNEGLDSKLIVIQMKQRFAFQLL